MKGDYTIEDRLKLSIDIHDRRKRNGMKAIRFPIYLTRGETEVLLRIFQSES